MIITLSFSFFFFGWGKIQFFLSKAKELLQITGQVSESLRPSLTALLGVNYPQIHHVLNAVPRSALLGWRKAISHLEIINQQQFDLLPTSDAAFFFFLTAASCLRMWITYKQVILCLLLFCPFISKCVCVWDCLDDRSIFLLSQTELW